MGWWDWGVGGCGVVGLWGRGLGGTGVGVGGCGVVGLWGGVVGL